MGRHSYRFAAAVAALAVTALAAPAAQAEPAPLNGLFALAPGVCANGAVTGSFFRMILPTGDANGPYLQNSDSQCSDQTVTPLSAGSDGGLISGSYQPQPASAFDGAGNALSGRVTTPVRFYGVDFATGTNPTDPQTGSGTGQPQLFSDGGVLSGDLSALGVTWNNQVFNQGSPKPGGGLPGKTSPVRGSIDAAGNFVIEWTSQIVGGPFNNFTGLWHLAGQYRGAQPAAPIAAVPGAPGTAGGDSSGGNAADPGTAAAPESGSVAGNSGAVAGSGQPGDPAAGAPGTPAAGPPQPGSAQPVNGTTGAQAVVAQGDPTLAATTTTTPAERRDRWLVPALFVVAVVAAGVFTNADRLVRFRK